MDFNQISQKRMLELLRNNFPDCEFETVHYDTEYITRMKETATDEVSAKKGAETDKERWGINYVIYVKGLLAASTDEMDSATKLYPHFKVSKTPEMVLADRKFVFDVEK